MNSNNHSPNSDPDPDPKPPNSRRSRRRLKPPPSSAHAQPRGKSGKKPRKAKDPAPAGHKQKKKKPGTTRKKSPPPPPAQSQISPPQAEQPARFFNDPILDEFIARTGQHNPDISHIQSPYLTKQLREFAACLAGFEASNNGSIELLAHLIKRYIMEEILRERFVTNDLVTIRGNFTRLGTHRLSVNGIDVSLDRREFVLLKVLHQHAESRYRARFSLGNPGDPFMPVNEILNEINHLKVVHKELGDVWNTNSDSIITRVVFDLRVKLSKAKLNKNLIESGPSASGYRFSTSLGNIGLDPGSGAVV